MGNKEALKSVENHAEVIGDPGRAAYCTFDSPLVQLAIESGASSGVGQGGTLDVSQRNEIGIMGLFDVSQVTSDQSVPVIESDPVTRMRSEHAAPPTIVDVSFTSPAPVLTPKIAEAVVSFSNLWNVQSPASVAALTASLDRAITNRVVQQVLNGTGTNDEVLGVLSTTGVGSRDVAAADDGKLSSFLNVEDLLPPSTPRLRRAWILDESLFRIARRTFVTPGASPRVLMRGVLADDARAYSVNGVLPAGHGLYGDWSSVKVALWDSVQVIFDNVQRPGTVRLTMLRYFDAVVARPTRIAAYVPV